MTIVGSGDGGLSGSFTQKREKANDKAEDGATEDLSLSRGKHNRNRAHRNEIPDPQPNFVLVVHLDLES